MADTQILAPLDNAPARLPVPAFAGRFAPFTQVFRQPAVQRALPAIATSAAIGIAALAWFMTQSAPQTQLFAGLADADKARSEEHTSELQSLLRISYAVFCLKTKKIHYSIYSPYS